MVLCKAISVGKELETPEYGQPIPFVVIQSGLEDILELCLCKGAWRT